MRIIFVRHGHPDYGKDCLTELGHPQAEAATERLKDERISKIFSSTCGRAVETARHIALRHNLDVEQLEFMREIYWGAPQSDDYVQPWWLVADWIKNGKNTMNTDWRNDSDYKGHILLESYDKVANGFDNLLKTLGLEREGNYYRVTTENNDTVMMVSHAGASTVALSHIFNIPFPFMCNALCPDFTAITVVHFDCKEKGTLVAPQFEIANDSRHIADIKTENFIGR